MTSTSHRQKKFSLGIPARLVLARIRQWGRFVLIDTGRKTHSSSILAWAVSLLLLSAACSGDVGIDADEDVFTSELRSQLDPFFDLSDPVDDPSFQSADRPHESTS